MSLIEDELEQQIRQSAADADATREDWDRALARAFPADEPDYAPDSFGPKNALGHSDARYADDPARYPDGLKNGYYLPAAPMPFWGVVLITIGFFLVALGIGFLTHQADQDDDHAAGLTVSEVVASAPDGEANRPIMRER